MRKDWEEILYKDAVYKISTTKQKLKQKEYSQFGEYPIIDQGQEKIGGYSDDKDRILDCKLPVLVFGDHTKCVKLINFKFIPGADGTKVLEPKQGIEPKYISTLTHVLVHKIKDKGYARHYQHIEKENLPLAPLPEQRAIVAKIEELFSDLDKGVADLKKAQDQLKVYRQAVLKKAFKELVNKGWEESLLGDISSKITKGSTPTTYGFKYQNEGINFIKIENVIDGKIDKKSIYQFISEEAHENQKRSQLHDGDVLFSIAGTIGETCLITKDLLPANTNQAFAIISGFNQVLDPNFLRKQLDSFMSRKLKDKARGGAMNNVSLTDLKNLKVVIPEMQIQHQVVKEIESRLSVCNKVEESVSESLEKAEALRQSILKKAFEGNLLSAQEIEKCKTALDYEPAAVLLEKIKNL